MTSEVHRLDRVAALVVGILLLLLAAGLNERTIGPLMPGGSIESTSLRLLLAALELGLAGAGTWFLVRRPSGSRRIAALLLALLAPLGLVETVALLTNVTLTAEFRARRALFYGFYQPDPVVGHKLRAGLRDYELSWPPNDVRARYSTDAHGFRNVGVDYDRARVFVAGDSFAFGPWVERPQTYFGQLETALGEPVVSLGVGAYGLVQYRLTLERVLQRFAPRLVVVCVFANDLERQPTTEELADFYAYTGWVRYAAPRARDRSLLGRVVTMAHHLKRGSSGAGLETPSGLLLHRAPGADPRYFEDDVNREVEAAFAALLDLLDAHRVKTLVAFLPSKESAYAREYRALYRSDFPRVESRAYGQLQALARERGADCVDLTPAFREASSGDEPLYFRRDPHWTVAGHTLAARELEPHVRRLLADSRDSLQP